MLKPILIAAWMILATASHAQVFGEPQPDPDQSSAARFEWEGVLVWNGVSVLPELKGQVAENMMSQAWASEAGKKAMRALGLSESAAKEALEISWPSGAGQINIRLTIPSDTNEARRAAKQFLK